jgi:hypothetical protein
MTWYHSSLQVTAEIIFSAQPCLVKMKYNASQRLKKIGNIPFSQKQNPKTQHCSKDETHYSMKIP